MFPTSLRGEERVPRNGRLSSDIINTPHPLKEGRVRMVQQLGNKTITVHVTLKIYSNNYDTYAVISMDKALCKDLGYISLKNATIKRVASSSSTRDSKENRHGFQITPEQRKLDLEPVTFYTSDSREVDQWMATVTENSRSQSPRGESRRPLLPLGQRPSRSRSGSNSSRPGSLLLPALEEEGVEE